MQNQCYNNTLHYYSIGKNDDSYDSAYISLRSKWETKFLTYACLKRSHSSWELSSINTIPPSGLNIHASHGIHPLLSNVQKEQIICTSKYKVEEYIRHIIRRIQAGSALRVVFEKSFGPILLYLQKSVLFSFTKTKGILR